MTAISLARDGRKKKFAGGWVWRTPRKLKKDVNRDVEVKQETEVKQEKHETRVSSLKS